MDANLAKEALNLPLAERIELVEELWESILAHPEALPLTDAQRAELDRRLARFEENPDSASPWETVRDRLWGQ
jgi:putative addiction module component (TIGR02574 family)